MSQRRRRWLSVAFGVVHAAALSLGIWALPGDIPEHETTTLPTAEMLEQDSPWTYLSAEAFQETQLAVRLAAAERERLQAQQLRIEAEAQAESLVVSATQRARGITRDAVQQADAIHLDSTFIGAEQVIYGAPGDAVTLKFAARIQCKAGSFGETAVATPLDWRITPREVRNLEVCFVSAQTPAGEPIGEIGDWGIGFFKLE